MTPSPILFVRSLPYLGLVSVLAAPLAFPSTSSTPSSRSALPAAGQIVEGFDSNANEDTSAFPRDVRARWDSDGLLTANSHFPGRGGPGGAFDWVVRSTAGGGVTTLSTLFTVITNDTGTLTQDVVNGYVDVRNLWIEPGAILDIRGPNPCRITVSGTALIEGKILGLGQNNRGVVTFNTGGPEVGAAGGPGGGRGGTGSIESTQSTPLGENGYGPFNALNGGGGGGETGYSPTPSGDNRRGAGGGGGRFGPDMIVSATGCPSQTYIGVDAEQGGPGAPLASGAISGPGIRPQPGLPGPTPFADSSALNDFWGRMQVGDAIVIGELAQPRAGAGGGGGGDCAWTSTFPTTPYSPTSDEIGAGGGGGGGQIQILALGDIVFGPAGRMDVSGGTGGGGENTSGINRIGAGSGGGSGGHLIVQTLGKVDLRACVATTSQFTGAGLFAFGGQGGEGANGNGGAEPGGVPTPPALDSINLNVAYASTCSAGTAFADVVGSGGDGGPGVIQIHVRSLADVLPPNTGTNTIARVIVPRPTGSSESTVNTPTAWNRLIPMYGPQSSSRSHWLAIGASGTPDLRFEGTGADGLVTTNGGGASARIPLLAPVAAGTLSAGPTPPYVDADGRTLVLHESTLLDDLYALEPRVLEQGVIALRHLGVTTRFDIGSAVRDAATSSVRLTVVEPGAPLAGYAADDAFRVHPRYFRVVTDGVRDWLPSRASIRVRFQGAPSLGGFPDETHATAWTGDIDDLEALGSLDFLRFQVDFDLAADGTPLTSDAPRPSLEFVREAFRD